MLVDAEAVLRPVAGVVSLILHGLELLSTPRVDRVLSLALGKSSSASSSDSIA